MKHPALKRGGLILALAALGATALTGCGPAGDGARPPGKGAVSVDPAGRRAAGLLPAEAVLEAMR
ncbi:hypothetical protein SLAVM298S_06518 [Streptomyces lavendulae subsp. lavendulae]